MVDSITPATTDALRSDSVAQALGVEDRWPVQRGGLRAVGHRGRLPRRDAGLGRAPASRSPTTCRATTARNYGLLNGAHSTLAYTGSLVGYRTVAETMGDASLREVVETLMTRDILPSLKAPRGLDLADYIRAILKRFRNPIHASRAGADRVGWFAEAAVPHSGDRSGCPRRGPPDRIGCVCRWRRGCASFGGPRDVATG